MQTTAKVEHRDYVPFGYIAIKFCNVSFSGDNAEKLDDEWHAIKFDKCQKIEEQVEVLNCKKNKLAQEMTELCNKRDNVNKVLLFFKSQEEKDLDNKILEIDRKIFSIDQQIEKINDDKFYSATELVNKAERFLNEHGFILDSCSSYGECVTKTDIWKINNFIK
jgi:hypothetical protein